MNNNIFKKIALLAAVICLLTVTKQKTMAQKVNAGVNLLKYKMPNKQNLFGIEVSFDASTINTPITPQKKHLGEVWLQLQLTDTLGNKQYYYEKLFIKSPPYPAPPKPGDLFSVYRKVSVPNGYYHLSLKATDHHNPKDTIKATIPTSIQFNDTTPQFSDIRLLKTAVKPTENKNDEAKIQWQGYNITPLNGNFIPEKIEDLYCSAEIYNLKTNNPEKAYVFAWKIKVVGSNVILKGFGNIKRLTPAPNLPILIKVNTAGIPSGNYTLVMELRNAKNEIIAEKQAYFQRSNPKLDLTVNTNLPEEQNFLANYNAQQVAEHLRALYPVANRIENSTIRTALEHGDENMQRSYLIGFWKRRYPKNPEEGFAKYQRKLEIVKNKYKAPGLAAYETDRGRVFLQYGSPNRIENENTDAQRRRALTNSRMTPYQIWYYYTSEWQNQNGIEFVFGQSNLGDNNYLLLHSTAVGELYNPNWFYALQNQSTNIRTQPRNPGAEGNDSDTQLLENGR